MDKRLRALAWLRYWDEKGSVTFGGEIMIWGKNENSGLSLVLGLGIDRKFHTSFCGLCFLNN